MFELMLGSELFKGRQFDQGEGPLGFKRASTLSFTCTDIFRTCSPYKDSVGLTQWKADNETGAGSWLSPYVAAVAANSLTGEREPKSQPALLP
jgi:hypothetical protein